MTAAPNRNECFSKHAGFQSVRRVVLGGLDTYHYDLQLECRRREKQCSIWLSQKRYWCHGSVTMRFYMTDDIQLRFPLLERMNCDWSLATIAALQKSCKLIWLYEEVSATDFSAVLFSHYYDHSGRIYPLLSSRQHFGSSHWCSCVSWPLCKM